MDLLVIVQIHTELLGIVRSTALLGTIWSCSELLGAAWSYLVGPATTVE